MKFLKTHEWIDVNGKKAKVGVSDYAQEQLGDIVFVNLPEIGTEVVIGKAYTDIESVKAVSEVFAGCSGKVVAVNEELLDAPEKINEAPYDSWIAEIEFTKLQDDLMDEAEYKSYVESQQ
ncbi:MAG: glycine cleavage system protein GcvH [Clostridia bacterium]|nr:glycine cleavage system protein GcvH [Clostridia bacterium]